MGFRETVQELADAYRDLRLFEVVCSFHFSEKNLSRELGLTLYRILQEAFNNTVKYAGASLVMVYLERRGDQLHLVYQDNGKGFDPSATYKGIGLNNIQNRVDAYQGRVEVRSAPGKGCELSVVLPLDTKTRS